MVYLCPKCSIERAWKPDFSADPSDPSKCVSCRPIFYFDSFLQVNSIVFFSFGADRVVMIAGVCLVGFVFEVFAIVVILLTQINFR
jgi:hypothetical protein